MNEKQKEYLIWRFKDGVRKYENLSLGNLEVLAEMSKEDVVREVVDEYLASLVGKGY